jgi:hypothetical protein
MTPFSVNKGNQPFCGAGWGRVHIHYRAIRWQLTVKR